MKADRNEGFNLEINLGSLSIMDKSYNSDDLNSLEQIEKIDEHFIEQTQLIDSKNGSNTSLQPKIGRAHTMKENLVNR